MGTFVIEGGHKLQGTIVPQGAKNEALEVICATLLTAEKVTIVQDSDYIYREEVEKAANEYAFEAAQAAGDDRRRTAAEQP